MRKVPPLALIALLFAIAVCSGKNLEPGLLGEYFYIGPTLTDFPELVEGQHPNVKRIDRVIDFKVGNGIEGIPFPSHFYVRWTGKIIVPEHDTYKFFLETDDGSELFIYDRKIIENGGPHPPTEKSGEVELPAGEHNIRIEYFQGIRTCMAKLSWESKKIQKQVVPASALAHEPVAEPPGLPPGPGLRADYYAMQLRFVNLPDFEVYEKPTLTRVDPVVAFPDAASFAFGNITERFYCRWTGRITVPQTGNYSFSLATDDGARLWVDGHKVVEHDGLHNPTREKPGMGSVALTEGEHDLRLDYFQNEGEAACSLWWEGPGIPKDIIPKTAFSH